MSILFNFWKPNFEKSFLNLLPFSSSELSHKKLPLNCLKSPYAEILNKPLKRNVDF